MRLFLKTDETGQDVTAGQTLIAQQATAPVTVAPVAEQPLPHTTFLLLIASATGLVVLFYLYCLVSLVLIACLIVFDVVAMIAASRFGLVGHLVKPIQSLLQLAALIFRSLILRGGVQYEMPLRREEEPHLYATVDEVARRIGVQPPRVIVLQSGPTAWVELKGYRAGRGRSRLGLGYDLLAMFTLGELEAVLAHEMAHARLVQRGYQGWLRNGTGRICRFANALDAAQAVANAEGRKFWTARLLGKAATVMARSISRLIAAYSRQDEFTADRIAAQLCGADVYRDALLHVYLIGAKEGELNWRDRIVQSERDESFSQWLRSRLASKDDAERRELEEKALGETNRSQFDTHPILCDRLAALPGAMPPTGASLHDAPERLEAVTLEPSALASPALQAPALDLLSDADALARRMINEFERIGEEEERNKSRELTRWVTKGGGKVRRNATLGQVAGALLAIAGTVLGLWTISVVLDAGTSPIEKLQWTLLTLFTIGAGVWIYRHTARREKLALPIPSFAAWMAATEAKTRQNAQDAEAATAEAAREAEIRAERGRIADELKAQMPPALKNKKEQAGYWGKQCYAALAVCDYRRAEVASGLARDVHNVPLEGRLGHAITSVYFGDTELLQLTMHGVLRDYGMTASTSWALGWSLALDQEWEAAEAYLLAALHHRARKTRAKKLGAPEVAQEPHLATLHSLLALCRWHNEKIREAMQSVREAIALEPDEAEHHLLLSRILLDAGRPRQALEELDMVEAETPKALHVMLGMVTANILLDRPEEALRRVALLEAEHPKPRTVLGLANAFMESTHPAMRERARAYFERASNDGPYPEARIGLAQLAYERKEFEATRALLLSALDVTAKRAGDAAHPLSLLGAIFRGLHLLDETPQACKAWHIKLDLGQAPVPVNALALRLCHSDENAAQSYASEIYQAMLPGHDAQQGLQSTQLLPAEEQPEEPISIGIYGHYFE